MEDCEQYFEIFNVPDNKKVVVAGMHLKRVAKRWYQACAAGEACWKWKDFSHQFSIRFGVLEQELMFERFKELKQVTTVEQYFGEFEKNMEQLKRKLPQLTEVFFVESFMSGLRPDIKTALLLLAPINLEYAYRKAK